MDGAVVYDHKSAPPTRPGQGSEQPRTAPAYLTGAQLAAIVQVDRATIFRWAARNEDMPQLRIGGVVRFPADRVLAGLRRKEGRRAGPRATSLRGPAGEVRESTSNGAADQAPCANSWAI